MQKGGRQPSSLSHTDNRMNNSSAIAQVEAINTRLKRGRCGVTLELRGKQQKLYVRGTFPPKPGSTKIYPYQQRHALKAKATPEALKQAEDLCWKLGGLLNTGQFTWDWFGDSTPADKSTFGYWVEAFEQDRWARVAQTRKATASWAENYVPALNRLPKHEPITLQAMMAIVRSYPPESSQRQKFVMVYGALADFAGLDSAPLRRLRGTYSPKSVSERHLPTDEEIEKLWLALVKDRPEWAWVFGVIAAYGLRPHEVFHLDFSGDDLRVREDTKTGARIVKPLHPHWVEQWNLMEPIYPKWRIKGDESNKDLGQRIGSGFYNYDIPFPAYNLRHAWAMRARFYRMDVDAAAHFLGHKPEEHRRTYLRWIGDEPYQLAYEAAINRAK